MSAIKGAKEFEKFKRGEKLTRKQTMKAQCYECNGYEEGSVDCKGISCPLYQYRLYPGKKQGKTTKEAINGS